MTNEIDRDEGKMIVTDDNLECPYLFKVDGQLWKFRGCTWKEAEWAKKGWDEGIAKARPIIRAETIKEERERIVLELAKLIDLRNKPETLCVKFLDWLEPELEALKKEG